MIHVYSIDGGQIYNTFIITYSQPSFAVMRTPSFSSVKMMSPHTYPCLPPRQETSCFSTPPLRCLNMPIQPPHLDQNKIIFSWQCLEISVYSWSASSSSWGGYHQPGEDKRKILKESLSPIKSVVLWKQPSTVYLFVELTCTLRCYQDREYQCGRWKPCFLENHRTGGFFIEVGRFARARTFECNVDQKNCLLSNITNHRLVRLLGWIGFGQIGTKMKPRL